MLESDITVGRSPNRFVLTPLTMTLIGMGSKSTQDVHRSQDSRYTLLTSASEHEAWVHDFVSIASDQLTWYNSVTNTT